MSFDVARLLRDFQSTTPVNVEGFIRTVGVDLIKDADLPTNISGQIKREGGKYVISTQKKEHYYRQRFTMAHELGHYLLHKSILDEVGGVDDNIKYRSTPEGNIYNSSIELIHERQANSFAANLLMPAERIKEMVAASPAPSLEALYKKFQVSASAMRWRLRSMGLDELVPGATQ